MYRVYRCTFLSSSKSALSKITLGSGEKFTTQCVLPLGIVCEMTSSLSEPFSNGTRANSVAVPSGCDMPSKVASTLPRCLRTAKLTVAGSGIFSKATCFLSLMNSYVVYTRCVYTLLIHIIDTLHTIQGFPANKQVFLVPCILSWIPDYQMHPVQLFS